jgi:hypothetical protein
MPASYFLSSKLSNGHQISLMAVLFLLNENCCAKMLRRAYTWQSEVLPSCTRYYLHYELSANAPVTGTTPLQA